MLLYRSFVVGLLGACCLLLAERPRAEVRLLAAAPPQAVVSDAPAIVDVSAQIDPAALAQLLHVPPGAQVFASGPGWSYADTFVARSEDLAPMLAQRMPKAGNFIELTVNGRRMLVLAH